MDAYGPLCDARNPLPADAATRRILRQAPTSIRQWNIDLPTRPLELLIYI